MGDIHTVHKSRDLPDIHVCNDHIDEINSMKLLIYSRLTEYQIAAMLTNPRLRRSTSRELASLYKNDIRSSTFEREDVADELDYLSSLVTLTSNELHLISKLCDSLRTPLT